MLVNHNVYTHVEGDLITIIDSSDLNLAKQLSRLLKITIFGKLYSTYNLDSKNHALLSVIHTSTLYMCLAYIYTIMVISCSF